MSKEIIETAAFKLPQGLPFCKGVKKRHHVYVSGAVSVDELGEFVGEGDIYKQTWQTLENILAVIKSAGGAIKDIVKVNICLKSMSDYEEMNKAYKAFFGEIPLPARTAIEAKLVYDHFLVEIDAVGILG